MLSVEHIIETDYQIGVGNKGYFHGMTRNTMDEDDIFENEVTLRGLVAERHKIISANCREFFIQLARHVELLERCGAIPDAETEPVAEYYAGMTGWLADLRERLNRLRGRE